MITSNPYDSQWVRVQPLQWGVVLGTSEGTATAVGSSAGTSEGTATAVGSSAGTSEGTATAVLGISCSLKSRISASLSID